jgi:hypothetical protein
MATNLINGPRRWKQFVNSATDGVQDPVYLTFALDFFPGGDMDIAYDYTGGDKIFFDSLFRIATNLNAADSLNNTLEWSTHAWLSYYGSPWTTSAGGSDVNSKISAAGHLLAARTLLVQLQSSPWYFQSIVGVDQLWKAQSQVKEGHKKIELTVNCLDSVKQPLLKLAEHYRRAIYDFDKLCYTVPDNMRTFNMKLKIYEVRDLLDRTAALDSTGGYQDIVNQPWLDNGLHQMIYSLHQCEFDFSDILGGPTNTEYKAYTEEKPFSTSFKIKAGWVREESVSTAVEDHQGLGIFSGVMETMEGRANSFLQNAIGIPQKILGNITNQFQTQLETKVMGNVYNNANNPGPIIGRVSPVGPSVQNLVNSNAFPAKTKAEEVNDLGNIYK